MKRTIKNGNPFRLLPEEFIIHSLTVAGVNKFWPYRILGNIRMVTSGNKHFINDIESAYVVVGEVGECKSLTLRVSVCFPDDGNKVMPGTIRYTLTKLSHKVTLKLDK